MDDYEVGSLAELISGNKVENKAKLIIKKIKPIFDKNISNAANNERVSKRNNFDHRDQVLRKKRKLDHNEESVVNKKKKKEEICQVVSFSNTDNASKKNKVKKDNVIFPSEIKPSHQKNAELRIKHKNKSLLQKTFEPDKNDSTIFVGNIPISSKKESLKRLFMKYGVVKSFRLRSAPVADPKTPKKVAVIKQQFHPNRTSLHGYVKYGNQEDAEKALILNGHVYEGHHLRIELCNNTDKPDEHNAIFIGNVNFDAEEEEIWKLFEPVGNIFSVRLIRDKRTGMGKGFGYVNFKSSDAVELALQMEPPVLKNREIRIYRCSNKAKKQKRKQRINNVKKHDENLKESGCNYIANTKNKSFQGSKFTDKKKRINNVKKHDKNLMESGCNYNANTENKSFQGSKFTDKKKHKRKLTKAITRKKILINSVLPRETPN